MTYMTNIRIGQGIITRDRHYWAWNAMHWQEQVHKAAGCSDNVQRVVRQAAMGSFEQAVRNGFVDC